MLPSHTHDRQALSDREADGRLIGFVCKRCAALFDANGNHLLPSGKGVNRARSRKYIRVATAANAYIRHQMEQAIVQGGKDAGTVRDTG